jgi:hypothetical protein
VAWGFGQLCKEDGNAMQQALALHWLQTGSSFCAYNLSGMGVGNDGLPVNDDNPPSSSLVS